MKIRHRVNTSGLVFQSGGGIALNPVENSDIVEWTTEGAEDNLYYSQKLEALQNIQEGEIIVGPYADPDTGITPVGPSWTFTDESIYLATLANISPEPETGVIFMTNDSCANVIQGSNALALIDICSPCLDCPTYITLQGYLDRINESVMYVWKLAGDKQTSTETVSPDGFPLNRFTGTYVQTLAALSFWNHLMNKQSVKSAGQAYGQSVSGTIYYKNISSNTLNNVGMTLEFIFAVRNLNTDVINTWNGINASNTEVRVIARESANGESANVVSQTINPDGATVVFNAPTVSPGESVYGDVALLLTNSGLFDNLDEQVLVIVRASYENTHLNPGGVYDDVEDKIVYFKPATEPAGSSS